MSYPVTLYRCILLLSLLLGSLQAEPARTRYTVASYADSPAGDYADGEDRTIRRIAVEALGKLNGAVVIAEADTGKVLTMVNQKAALADGYIPCSTIKLVIALAALNEGVIEPAEKVFFPGGWYMTIVEGLTISNNVIFDHLGEKLGFATVRRYARLFGLGEKAGWEIPGEQVGAFPESEHSYGVGRMSSFGDGIYVTPLQLAALTGAIANGGRLYYLQHPPHPEAAERFEPRLKRELPIGRWLSEIRTGMDQAVRRGTAKGASLASAAIRGKTGTCSLYLRRSRSRVRMGWFTSYWETAGGSPLSVVVMLRGGAGISGPLAARVAGRIYRGLTERLAIASVGDDRAQCDCGE